MLGLTESIGCLAIHSIVEFLNLDPPYQNALARGDMKDSLGGHFHL